MSVCNVSTEDMATEDNGSEDAYMSKSLIAIRIYCMSIFLRVFYLPGSKVASPASGNFVVLDSPSPCCSGRSFRSTPTRVGTTPRQGGSTPHTTVHPHTRGDNALSSVISAFMRGPPPRPWGQQAAQPLHERDGRSTPTRVGTTSRPVAGRPPHPVHPHARGDNATSRPGPTDLLEV